MPAPAPALRQIPRAAVPPPPQPGVAPYGLLSSATLGEGITPHELNGIEYESVCSTDVREWPAPCSVAAGGRPEGYDRKETAPTSGVTTGDPFALYAAESCLLGTTDPGGMDRLRSRFRRGEPSALEWHFWHGTLGQRPALEPDALVLSDTALPLRQAIGLLEHWLACVSGSTGMIHLPRWVGELVVSDSILTPAGPIATTRLGSTLVLGTGYPGTAPEAADDTTNTWIYATTPVTVRRSGLIEPADWENGAADLATNQGVRLVERMYVIDVPCHHVAAVRTDLPLLSPVPTAPPEEPS